jgi:hypothetical protein
MGSGFDNWVHWHFFTIAFNYNSSHTEFLLHSHESPANLCPLEFTNQLHYNCHAAGIAVTVSYSSHVLVCCHENHVFIPKQRFGFLSVYNFQCPYPWKLCSVITWFPKNNLSVAVCLPILFLDTTHISQYQRNIPSSQHHTSFRSVSIVLLYA